jgi:thioredoxin 1
MSKPYENLATTRAEIDARREPLVLEFGANWCGWCRAAQPHISAALGSHPGIAHLKVEDGKGRPLGRSFRVKLWPTLIFLRDGAEIARVVRPQSEREVGDALARIASSP